MTDAEVRTRIQDIVRQFASEARDPDPTESLFDTGLLDSFVLPQVVASLEEAFHIRVPDADLNPRNFDTLAQMEAYVSKRT